MLTIYNDRHVLHGDPRAEYPYYLGCADECGVGDGLGFNLNVPLLRGTGFDAWRAALGQAPGAIAAYGAEALAVSVNVLAGFDRGAG